MDERLWEMERYLEFLEARRELLAAETNRWLTELLPGDEGGHDFQSRPVSPILPKPPGDVIGAISSEEEEQALVDLNDWVEAQGLARGQMEFDFTNEETGVQEAVFDLAWPDGLQFELSQPVAVLLNEPPEVAALAGRAGYRFFTEIESFKQYVESEILGLRGEPSD